MQFYNMTISDREDDKDLTLEFDSDDIESVTLTIRHMPDKLVGGTSLTIVLTAKQVEALREMMRLFCDYRQNAIYEALEIKDV